MSKFLELINKHIEKCASDLRVNLIMVLEYKNPNNDYLNAILSNSIISNSKKASLEELRDEYLSWED